MGWRAGQGSGTDGDADPDPGLPDRPKTSAPEIRAAENSPREGAGSPVSLSRDERLAGFAPGGEWDACPPSIALAAALDDASGPDWRCVGATHAVMSVIKRTNSELSTFLRICTFSKAWPAVCPDAYGRGVDCGTWLAFCSSAT